MSAKSKSSAKRRANNMHKRWLDPEQPPFHQRLNNSGSAVTRATAAAMLDGQKIAERAGGVLLPKHLIPKPTPTMHQVQAERVARTMQEITATKAVTAFMKREKPKHQARAARLDDRELGGIKAGSVIVMANGEKLKVVEAKRS